MTDKTLPANIEAEAAVLGSCLMNRDAITTIAAWLKPGMFYLERHARIFEAMLTCFNRREPPDLRLVSEELRRRERLDTVGGVPALADLLDAVPTSYHVEHYARIVERTHLARNLIVAGGKIAAIGYDEQDDIDAAQARAQTVLTQATRRSTARSLTPVASVASEVWERITSGVLPSIPTGLKDYDAVMGGLFPGDLTLIAARPSVGKTSLALSIVYELGRRGCPVLFLSLEMSNEQLLHRLVAMQCNIPIAALRNRSLSPEQMPELSEALGVVSDWPITLCDLAGQSSASIRGLVMQQLQAAPGSVVFIDYLQLMSSNRRDNRVQEVSEISRNLKVLARDAGVPVVALSQLSRAVEGRAVKVPELSDLRESGSLEQDADIVVFIHREELYQPDPGNKGVAHLYVKKHRQGPLAVIPFFFDAPTTRFRDLDWRHNARI